MYSRMLAAVSIFALTAACQDSRSIVAPTDYVTDQSHPIMVAESPSLFSLFQGDDVPAPSVRVIWSSTGNAFAGVPVSFTFGDGNVVKATTDADGNASAYWPLDYSKSADSVMVAADGISGTMKFKALIVNKATVATYELQSIGGRALPITYGGGDTTWAVTGGRYRLFGDSTYVFGYEINGKQGWGPLLPYFKRDSTIEFYLTRESAPLSSFYANLNYLFSTGTANGGGMSVKYTDPIDFEDEIYVLK
jgi:hypothetical protein